MQTKAKKRMMLIALLLLVMLMTSVVSADEGDVPQTVDQLDAEQVAKSLDHSSVMSYLQEGQTARLIIVFATPTDFVGVAGLEGDAEAVEMAKIDTLQSTFMVNHVSLVDGLVAFEYSPMVSVWVESEAEYAALLADENVVILQQDIPVPVNDLDVAPPAMAQAVPWVDADDAHTAGYTGDGYTVAILDTGVDKNHYYLDGGKVVSEACYSTTDATQDSSSVCAGGVSSSTAAGSAEPYVGNCPSGWCDHGTHVAGIAAGTHTGFTGIAPDAHVIAIQVFSRFDDNVMNNCGLSYNTCALTWNTDQILGLERVYALRFTYDITSVNMSLGSGKYTAYCDTDTRKTSIDNLAAAGIATVISSGNSYYKDGVGKPGCISTAYTIGATHDNSDIVADFSNADSTMLDMWAPGVDITSSVPTETYGGTAPTDIKSGTSMSAPMVTGAFAVVSEMYPTYTLGQLWTVLANAGVTVTDTRVGGDTVAPRLDFTNAIPIFVEPGIPVHLTPEKYSITLDSTPQFSWQEASDADKYTLEIKRNDNNALVSKTTYTAAARCSGGVCTVPSPVTLSNGVAYKWHVVAYNGTNKGTWSGWWVFKIALNSLTIPSLRSPGVGAAVYGGRPTFKWYEVSGANGYNVQLIDTDGTTVIGDYEMNSVCGTYCEYRIPRVDNLDSNYGTYQWRVQAKNFGAGTMSSWSAKRSFIFTKVGPTSLITPADSASTASHRPVFSWSQAVGATKYIVQVRDPYSDAILVHQLFSDADDCSGGTCTGQIGTYLENGTYNWHVRGKNGTNYGNWTSYRAIIVNGEVVSFYYNFNSDAGGWVDVKNHWWIYNSMYYRGEAGTTLYKAAPTYHNYLLSDATMTAEIRSTGANGEDGFVIYAYTKYSGATLTQCVEIDIYSSGGDLYAHVWVYTPGYGWSWPISGQYLGTYDITQFHTYKLDMDAGLNPVLWLEIDNTYVFGFSGMGFYDGSFGFDVFSQNPTDHWVDVNSALISVYGYLPAPLPAGYFPNGDSPDSAYGLDEQGERIIYTGADAPEITIYLPESE